MTSLWSPEVMVVVVAAVVDTCVGIMVAHGVVNNTGGDGWAVVTVRTLWA